MDFILLVRRAALVALIVGLGASVAVYFFSDWWHDSFQPMIGIESPLGDAIGAFVIIVVAFLAQRVVSIAFYKDWMFGLGKREAGESSRADDYVAAAEQVGGELK